MIEYRLFYNKWSLNCGGAESPVLFITFFSYSETHSDSVLPEINLSPSSKTSQNKETYVKSRPYRVQTRSACKQTTVKTQLGTSNLGKGNSKREIKVSHGKLTQNGTHKQRKGKGIREKTVDNGKDRAAGGSGSNTVVQGCSRKQIKLEPKSREDKRTKEKIVTDPKDSVVKNDGILNQTKSGHEGNVEKTVSTKIKARIKNGSEALKAAIGTELKDINVKEEAGIKSEKLEDLIGSIADCNFVTVKKDGVETVWPIDKVYDKREDGSLQPYTCKMCCKYFRTRSLVINHVRTVHSSDTPYRCKVCAELYKEKDAILKHIRIHEDKIQHLKIYGGKNQHSNQCKTEDKSRPLLDYKCVLCGFEAKNKVEIREHFTKIHNKMKVKCDQCEKPFRDSFALRRHKVVKHSTEKNVKCDVCSKAFKLHENMILHRRRFHDPKFECEICGAKQPTSYILKKHVEMVHEKKNEMVCEVCGKGFVYAHRFRVRCSSQMALAITSAVAWQNQQNYLYAQHLPSLNRIFAVHFMGSQGPTRTSWQQRLRSDWADAQADLSLCWAHNSILVSFVMQRLISEYRKTGNFCVVQFSRNFAVSIDPRKLKSAKYFLFLKN